jgi:hypothetical protein
MAGLVKSSLWLEKSGEGCRKQAKGAKRHPRDKGGATIGRANAAGFPRTPLSPEYSHTVARQAQFRFSGKPPSLIIKHFDTWKLTKKKKVFA